MSHDEHEHEHGGHDDHGHEDHGHEEEHGDEHEEDGGHDHGEEYGDEHEEELYEAAGSIYDLYAWDEDKRIIDVTGEFPISNVLAVRHNDQRSFNDLKKGEAKVLDFTKRKTIRLSKLRSKRFSDVLPRKECSPSLLAYVDKSKIVRPEPLSLTVAVEVPENGIDLRELRELPKTGTYPDVIFVRPPLRKKIARYVRRRKKILIRTTALVTGFAAFAGGGIIWAVHTAEREVETAYAELFELQSQAADMDAAAFQSRTETLKKKFVRIEWLLSPIETLFNSPIYSQKRVALAGNVVRWGGHLSEAAWQMGSVWRDFSDAQSSEGAWISNFGSGSQFKFTDFVRTQIPRLRRADNELSLALAEYSKVDSFGDPELDTKFKGAVSRLMELQNRLKTVLSKIEPVLIALGDKAPQRYLVLNQNRDELRPMGGFPGSAIFLEFYKGRLEKYERRDIYYYDWHLFPLAPKAPPGLDRVSEKWGLRDANYYPELDRNFAVIDDFYQKSGGSSLNGVVFINQSLVTDFLAKYGGVSMPSIGKTLDAENFSALMSVLVENRIGANESSKDVLFEFVSNFETMLKTRADYAGYLDLFLANAQAGEILAYSNDADVNAFFRETFPWERVKELGGNFAYPVFVSISGNKSDRYAYRKFELSSKPVESSECRVLNRFSLETDHRMTTDQKEGVRRLLFDLAVPAEKHEQQIAIQGNGENRQYVRLLVPKGSKLFGTPPMQTETDDSNPNYVSFAFYTNTEPGKVSAAFLDYETPLSDCSSPAPVFVRQAGLQNYTVETK